MTAQEFLKTRCRITHLREGDIKVELLIDGFSCTKEDLFKWMDEYAKVKNVSSNSCVSGSLGSIREKLWQKKLQAEGNMANPPEGACPEYKDRMLGRSWGLADAIELLSNDR